MARQLMSIIHRSDKQKAYDKRYDLIKQGYFCTEVKYNSQTMTWTFEVYYYEKGEN